MLEAEGTDLEGGEFGDWLLLISHDIPGCVRCQHPLKVMCSFHFNLCVFEGLSGVSGGAGPAFVKLLKGTFWTMFLDVTVTNSIYFNQLKGHSVVFGKNFFFTYRLFCLIRLNEQTLCFHDRINKWANKLTLKDKRVSNCFTLFICGGPCHLLSFKQYSGDLISLWEQLVYSVMEKMDISEFVLLPH